MTKSEWINFVRTNAQLFEKYSITAKQLWVLLSALKQNQEQSGNPWLYLPTGMPDGLLIEEDDAEINDLVQQGLLRDEYIGCVKRQVCIMETGEKRLKEFFNEAKGDGGYVDTGDGYGA